MTPNPDQDALSAENRRGADRQQWASEVAQVIASFPRITFGLAAGGFESGQFLVEAVACYGSGLFLAALTCAHATCERELAGRVAYRPHEAPPGWERWGLGRLIQHAREQAWHPEETLALLSSVNEKRRVVYHFRDFGPDEGLFMRTYAARPWRGKPGIREDMTDQLRVDALEAIRAALAVRLE